MDSVSQDKEEICDQVVKIYLEARELEAKDIVVEGDVDKLCKETAIEI